MARVEGTQSIPSEINDGYRQLLTPKTPDGIVRLRYPYRVPGLQNLFGNPSQAQRDQRARFRTAVDNFNAISPAERSRWYDTMPPWGSFLWYYDWFILSALMGVTGLPGRYEAVIKSIHYYPFTIPTGVQVDITVSITAVDPLKAVVMLFGAGFDYYQDTIGVANYPYPKAIYSSSMILRGSLPNTEAAECGALVIEYI
jgi:hypothetical protein